MTDRELRLPLNRTVKLEITTKDVIHSFWVPEFAQKQDVVPGLSDDARDHARPARHLPGDLHRALRPRARADAREAIVMQPADFDAWVKGAHAAAVAGGGAAAGKAVFAAQGCGACHTFKAARARPARSAPTSTSRSSRTRSSPGSSLADFIRQSIIDPNAYISPGYQPSVMPRQLRLACPKSQLDALVHYLAANTVDENGEPDDDRTPRPSTTSSRSHARNTPAAGRLPAFAAPGWRRVLLVDPARRVRRARSRCLDALGSPLGPVWTASPLVTVARVAFPIGFLVGIGVFDYWVYYFSGARRVPEDHSGHGACRWQDYFRSTPTTR